MARNATDIRISIDGNTIARATSGSISMTTNMLDSTNKDSGGDREVLPAVRSFSLSSEAILDFSATFGLEGMFDAWKNGTKLSIKWYDTKVGGLEFSGSGYISDCSADAPSEDLATISATIEGTAALSKATT